MPQTAAVWLISAVLVAWAVTNFGVGVAVDSVGEDVVAGAVAVGAALAEWFVAVDGPPGC